MMKITVGIIKDIWYQWKSYLCNLVGGCKIEAVQKNDYGGSLMTNIEKISNMNTEDLSTFLVGFHAFPLAEYVAYEKWLNSESPDRI